MYEDIQLDLHKDNDLQLKINLDKNIETEITTSQNIGLAIDKEIPLDVDFQISSNLELYINEGGSALPYYEGEYEVNPRKVQQILETKNKSMANDVVINPIFYSEVTNPQGGNTVVIGQE